MVSECDKCKKRWAADLHDLTTTVSADAKNYNAILDIVVASLRLALQTMQRVKADNDAKAGLPININRIGPDFSN